MPSATNTAVALPITLKTPALNRSDLCVTEFQGREAISQLFHFEIHLLIEHKHGELPFEKLLGQPVTVSLPMSGNEKRYFNGIVNSVAQGERDSTHTGYRVHLVPRLWLLTKKAQSRVFQHKTVVEILEEVLKDLKGLDVAYELTGSYLPHDYCVQYRETDFNFVSRLMEEEGIFYHFRHADGKHTLVLGDTAASHRPVPGQTVVAYDTGQGGRRPAHHVDRWQKAQQLRAGKFTLRDHSFELTGNGPGMFQDLQAASTILPAIPVGQETHALCVGGNDRLEIYDFPGEYAHRCDGVQPGGGERDRGHPQHVNGLAGHKDRAARLRMQQEAVASLGVGGVSNCPQFTAGHRFVLTEHFNANGEYVLTGVRHSAQQSRPRSGRDSNFAYHNDFTCIPVRLPFRPPRVTAKPLVQGVQTAVVVGSGAADEEVFTDKYGRVKVRFHWDRRDTRDANSSCWVRVGTPWAGKQWGMLHIPRVGQEVIVAFRGGDPDQPLVVGSVYNAEQMPPFLNEGGKPVHPTQSGIKTRSSPKGTADNFNELRFEDKKGAEHIYFHAERDFQRVVKNNDSLKVGSAEAPDGSQTVEVWKDRTATLKTGSDKLTVEKGNYEVRLGEGNQTVKLDMGKSETEALQSIEFKVGESSIRLDPTGITLKGLTVKVESQLLTEIKGGLATEVKAGVLLQVKSDGIMMLG